MIPFVESFIEPRLRKHPKVNAWFISSGDALKKNLKLIAWVCIFIGCYRAWSFEHRNAQTAMYGKDGKSEAWAKYNQCDKERAIKSSLADTYAGQVAEQRGRLDNGQDIFNRCVLTLQQASIPERQKLTVKEVHTLTYPDAQGKIFMIWTVLAFSNKVISPARGELTCANNFIFQSFEIAENWQFPKIGFGRQQVNDRQVKFSLQSPAWKPESPLVFTLATQGDGSSLGACSVNPD